MTIYAGLDVSDKTTHICVVDGDGLVIWRGVGATDPLVLAETLGKRCRGATPVVFETGAISCWGIRGMAARG